MTETLSRGTAVPVLVDLEPRRVAVVRVVAEPREFPALLPAAFEASMQQIAQSGGQVAGPPFARYLKFGQSIEAEAGFPSMGSFVPTEKVREANLPGGRAALLTYVGPYDRIGEAWNRISSWIREQSLVESSAPWENYLTGPDEPGMPVTQIVVPVA